MIESEKKQRRQKKLQQVGGQKYTTYCLKEYKRTREQSERAARALCKLIKQLRHTLPTSEPDPAHAHTRQQGSREKQAAAERKGGGTSENEESVTDTSSYQEEMSQHQFIISPFIGKQMQYPETKTYKVPINIAMCFLYWFCKLRLMPV